MRFLAGLIVALALGGCAQAHDTYEPWLLTDQQRTALSEALTAYDGSKFTVWFYPLGRGTGLPPDQYGTDIFRVFRNAKWPVRMLAWNWVVPEATGLSVATCPPPDDAPDMVWHRAETLAGILTKAGIPHGRSNEDDLGRRGCAVGLVIGKPD